MTTVEAWSDRWLAKRETDLAAHTHGTYASAVRRWIVPTIGRKRLASLTPGDLREVTRVGDAAGKAPSSTLATRRILAKMLRDARVDGQPIPARIFDVKAHTPPEPERDAIPLLDAGAILNASLELPHTSRWIVASFEGIRPGEALGLTRDHVDLDRGIIDIEYQLDNLPYLDREAGTFRHPRKIRPVPLWKSYHLVPPKTARGRRVIPIVGPALAALQQWREIAPESPHNLVWPRSDGRPQNSQHDTREWMWLQDRAQVASVSGTQGRSYDGYEARHTTATLLLEIGADPKVIEAILGHSSIVTSRCYQHVRQDMARSNAGGRGPDRVPTSGGASEAGVLGPLVLGAGVLAAGLDRVLPVDNVAVLRRHIDPAAAGRLPASDEAVDDLLWRLHGHGCSSSSTRRWLRARSAGCM